MLPISRFALPLFLACTAVPTFAQTTSSDNQALEPLVRGFYPKLEVLYKDIHAHPELGFQEVRTAATLASEMRKLGFEVTEKVGKTGVVAVYRNGDGPTVLVRTELDALPMEEKTGLPYASTQKASWQGKETFVAHSCGHDIHMASWVGTAQALLAIKGQWKGTLVFVAQPAEEVGGGALGMLRDGLYTRFPKPDAAFALHTAPAALGTIGYHAGPVTSASDAFQIKFKGRGGHGSAPNLTVDPIAIGAHFVTDVQTVVSREKDPAEFGVLTVGAFQAGTAGNIIPDEAVLRGTLRSFNPKVRELLIDGVRRTAKATAAMAGAPEPEIDLDPSNGTPAVVNDGPLVRKTVAALKTELGDANIVEVPPVTASEDFSEFAAQGVPTMFFFLGVIDPKVIAAAKAPGGKPVPFNHSPLFAPVPEPSITTGVRAMTTAVLAALTPGK